MRRLIRKILGVPEPFRLQVMKLEGSALDLRRSSEFAAGYDIFCNQDVWVHRGCQAKISTGIATAFTPGWVALVMDRSGLGAKGIARHCGVIDADYRGEWFIALRNHSENDIFFKAGDRVAQVVFVPHGAAQVESVYDLPTSGRGAGGFGSTGR